MLCNSCNQENASGVVVCSNCRHSLSTTQAQTPPPLTPVNIAKDMRNSASSSIESADTLLAAFVGEKYDSYYRDKWFTDSEPHLILDKNNMQRPKFNIAGALLGIFWLCYRKMYKVAFLVMLGMTIVDTVMMYVLGEQTYNAVSQSLLIGAGIVIPGLFGNYFYFNHSIKHIKKIKASISDPNIIQERLTEEGGTSWLGSIGFAILIIAMSVAVAYFFAPDWYWLE